MSKRNILIITYDWPPRNSIAVYRPYAWAKYWAAQDVCVTILTAKKCIYDEPLDLNMPAIDGVEVFEVAYRNEAESAKKSGGGQSKVKLVVFDFLKKNSSTIKKLIGLNYDVRDRWADTAAPQAIEICKAKKIDIVVSTYGPRACHFIAAKIKEKIPSIKWVADYRDLWSIRHNSDMTASQARKERSLEKSTLENADFLMTVSKPLATELAVFLGKNVSTVFNGFDVEWADAEKKIALGVGEKIAKEKIEIIYTGMIYPGWRDPASLFVAVNNLIQSNKIKNDQVEIHFYGKRQPGLYKLVKEKFAESFVKIHGHVSREAALHAQEKADLLLLLESGEEVAKGVLTGKIFEYMVSGVPILSLGSREDSAIGEVISETGVGVVCADNVGKIEKSIMQVLQGNVDGIYSPNLDSIRKYSRKIQAENLLHHLKKVLY